MECEKQESIYKLVRKKAPFLFLVQKRMKAPFVPKKKRYFISQIGVCTIFIAYIYIFSILALIKCPLFKVTAEDETGISIWDLRKPKVPIQQLPGHTHWYLFKETYVFPSNLTVKFGLCSS